MLRLGRRVATSFLRPKAKRQSEFNTSTFGSFHVVYLYFAVSNVPFCVVIHKETSPTSKLLPTSCVCVMSRHCCRAFQTSVLVSLSTTSEAPSSSMILERRHAALHPTSKTPTPSVRLHGVRNSRTIVLVRLQLDSLGLQGYTTMTSDFRRRREHMRTHNTYEKLSMFTPIRSAHSNLFGVRRTGSTGTRSERSWLKEAYRPLLERGQTYAPH